MLRVKDGQFDDGGLIFPLPMFVLLEDFYDV